MFDLLFFQNVINCDSISFISDERDNELLFKNKICSKFKGYEKVELRPIKIIQKKLDDRRVSNVNHINIDPPLAGNVRVTWVDEKKTITTIIYELSAIALVSMFTRELKANSTINETDIRQQKINIAPFLGVKTFLTDRPVGLMVLRRVTKGSYVFSDIVAPVALIHQNQKIVAVIRSNGLSIKVNAIALENGFYFKDVIKMRVLDTGAVLKGRIEGDKYVYVDM